MFPFHQRQMGEKLYCKTVFQFSNPLVALPFQGVRLNRASRIWLLPVWPICYPIFEVFVQLDVSCVQELLSLKMEPLQCLLPGKFPDHTSKPAIVTLRVHVFF